MRILTLIVLTLAFFSCVKKQEKEAFVFQQTPFGAVPEPASNKATAEGIALGKKLFFDPILSANNKVSCAGCHLPALAFSDGAATSVMGVSGAKLTRHSPALFNLAWMQGTFWDGGAKNLESQVFGPLTHPDEMAADLKQLADKLNKHPQYPALFKQVWDTDSVTSQLVARAIAQYERTLISCNAPFDQWKAGKARLTTQQLSGYAVYKSKCAGCHTEGLFTDNSYHNNGLDAAFTDRREEMIRFGRYRITNDSADIGRYKTPSLRNLGFTSPYMHDGRFATLDQVFDHYDHGIEHNSFNLDKALVTQDQPGIRLSKQEREDLKAFFKTLNDQEFINSHR